MVSPRFLRDTVPSAAALNALADAVDALGIGVRVERTAAQPGIPAYTDQIVTWQRSVNDTLAAFGLPMWSSVAPTYVRCRMDGMYLATLIERWGPESGAAPYGAGQRAGKILVNGTSPFGAAARGTDKIAADASGEGVTVQMRVPLSLRAGDLVYSNLWQSSGSTITGLHTDFGGTSLTLQRRGPLTVAG